MLKYVLLLIFMPPSLCLFELVVRKGVVFIGQATCMVLLKPHLFIRVNTCSMVICICLISALVDRFVEHGRADTSASLQAPLYRIRFLVCLWIVFPWSSHHPSAFFFRNHNEVAFRVVTWWGLNLKPNFILATDSNGAEIETGTHKARPKWQDKAIRYGCTCVLNICTLLDRFRTLVSRISSVEGCFWLH